MPGTSIYHSTHNMVQDIAKGSTASSLGLSTTTLSLEALRMLLAIGYCDFGCIHCLLAFTSSERIESDYPIAKRCFCVQGLLCPGLYDLDQAMNGLRVAAKAWNLKLATVVKKVGLKQCPMEVYADASWAPQAALGRRSVSGIAIFYRGCLTKGISRVQGCVSCR